MASTLSVQSRRLYFCSSLRDWWIFPAVLSSSSRVLSTVALVATSMSSVAADFCVVSCSCFEIEIIRSVTLSCWNSRDELRCVLPVVGPPGPTFRCRTSLASGRSANSSSLFAFSISSIVLMLAFRNACSVLQGGRDWAMISLVVRLVPCQHVHPVDAPAQCGQLVPAGLVQRFQLAQRAAEVGDVLQEGMGRDTAIQFELATQVPQSY
uniref:Uncharacterized protein n=1 Tax=Anopheles melas TaxID=34690 RepID=A0A182U0X6_9DIPT